MAMPTPEQRRSFDDNGFLLVSGLIPEGVPAAARAALWKAVGADPGTCATWPERTVALGCDDPAVTGCFTNSMAEFVDVLSGEAAAGWTPPDAGFAIIAFPVPGPWTPQPPHIDHALPAHGHRVFPRPMRLASLLYLNDVAPCSGGTVVWPGSHKAILALAESDPERFALMTPLDVALRAELSLGEGIEVGGKEGDVLFYHYLTAHSGSSNAGGDPRFALAYKW